MGLIAREIESRGVPTLCMSSALSITQAVHPPRAVFLNFPLGHTTGKADDPELQRAIIEDALEAFESITTPGEVVPLPYEWGGADDWGRSAMVGSDDRGERVGTPQYQTEADRILAERELARGGCPTCVWVGDDVDRG